MKKDLLLIGLGIFLALVIVCNVWFHTRIKGLENFANQLIVNSQRQAQKNTN